MNFDLHWVRWGRHLFLYSASSVMTSWMNPCVVLGSISVCFLMSSMCGWTVWSSRPTHVCYGAHTLAVSTRVWMATFNKKSMQTPRILLYTRQHRRFMERVDPAVVSRLERHNMSELWLFSVSCFTVRQFQGSCSSDTDQVWADLGEAELSFKNCDSLQFEWGRRLLASAPLLLCGKQQQKLQSSLDESERILSAVNHIFLVLLANLKFT